MARFRMLCYSVLLVLAAHAYELLPLQALSAADNENLPMVIVGVVTAPLTGDSETTERLGKEWNTAATVAKLVLEKKYPDFFVSVVPRTVQCNFSDAAYFAEFYRGLPNVVAVVGPHCSEALRAMASVLTPAGIPIISYAATADDFSDDRWTYRNVFRTVWSDKYQAQAIVDTVKELSFSKMNIMHSSCMYGKGLSSRVEQLALSSGIKIKAKVAVPFPPPNVGGSSFWLQDVNYSSSSYEPFFDKITADEDSITVVIASPAVAESLFKAAVSVNKTDYPYWYLGSDGVVAFDVVTPMQKVPAELAFDSAFTPFRTDIFATTEAMQGELGVAASRGNALNDVVFEQFKSFWQEKNSFDWPGLLTDDVDPRFTEPREYVRNLIDAMWALYEAIQQVVMVQGNRLNDPAAFMRCFRNESCVSFQGASGKVFFNKTTGERGGIPEYRVVNLKGMIYEDKAKWIEGRPLELNKSTLARPGPVPKNSKVKAALPLYSIELPAGNSTETPSESGPSPPSPRPAPAPVSNQQFKGSYTSNQAHFLGICCFMLLFFPLTTL